MDTYLQIKNRKTRLCVYIYKSKLITFGFYIHNYPLQMTVLKPLKTSSLYNIMKLRFKKHMFIEEFLLYRVFRIPFVLNNIRLKAR